MSRTSPGRRALRDGAPHDRLLVAASTLFTRRGYAATSVREIVELARVTKPVLYYHFGSKEGLYRALLEQLFDELESRLGRRREHDGTSRERIAAICRDVFELVHRRLEMVRFFYSVYYGSPQSAPAFDYDIFTQRFRAAISDAIRDGIASGEIRQVALPDLVTALEAMVNIAIETLLTEPRRHFSSADLDRLIDLLFAGAGAAPEPTAAHRMSPYLQETSP
jgi:AcrR family transcriptional regulator